MRCYISTSSAPRLRGPHMMCISGVVRCSGPAYIGPTEIRGARTSHDYLGNPKTGIFQE